MKYFLYLFVLMGILNPGKGMASYFKNEVLESHECSNADATESGAGSGCSGTGKCGGF